MADKQLTGRQELFVGYYCEGETAGNVKQSMLKAGFTSAYAEHGAHIIMSYGVVSDAIAGRQGEIEDYEAITIESVNKAFAVQLALCIAAKDRPTAARILENQGKHVGYYREDNLQTTQQRELSDSEVEAAQRIAAIANREGIKLQVKETA